MPGVFFMYSFGKIIQIRLFGKSHAPAVGCILEGLPSGISVSSERIASEMSLRKPSPLIGTARTEPDSVRILSGIENGRTNGLPVTIMIENKDTDARSYDKFRTAPRPGHADMPALLKDPGFDIRGGGQFSGRMTAPFVAAGSIARQFLETKGIEIAAFASSIGSVRTGSAGSVCAASPDSPGFDDIRRSVCFKTRALNAETDRLFEEEILKAAADSDSIGGIVECRITGLPAGFGGVWFEALDCGLACGIFGIPAVKGIEFGKGFGLAGMRGSESNDPFIVRNGKIRTETNNAGGILGGMSSGSDIVFRAVFKPTPSIGKEQRTVNPETLEETTVTAGGRHDPCIVPRAVAVVEAVAALVIADQVMREPEHCAAFAEENRYGTLPGADDASDRPDKSDTSDRPDKSDTSDRSEKHSLSCISCAGLDILREEIAAADLEILRAMKKRMDAAGKIGRLKASAGLPVRNPDVEENVIGRCRRVSGKLGLDPDVSEDIFRILIRSAVREQESIADDLKIKRDEDGSS